MGKANIRGPRIKQARERLGWDQSELAAALEVDFQIKLDQMFLRLSDKNVESKTLN
jgi:ribosome-binding protein aMBF1 (putative translation factor)